MSEQIDTIMVGPALSVRGGMASVVRLILERPPAAVHLRYIATFEEGPPLRRTLAFFRGLVGVLTLLLQRRGNLLHIHFSQRASVGRAIVLTKIGRLFGIPVVLHAHASEFKLYFEALPTWLRILIRRELGRCDRLLCLSESWAEYYHSQLGIDAHRVVVLPNPVVLPTRPAIGSGMPLTLTFLGRIGERKGSFDLIDAVQRMPAVERSQIRLVLAGDGDLERARSQVRAAGLDEIVNVQSWLSPEARDGLLERTDIYLLPSYNEGLPMSVLEAMAWGIAVVTTPVGGLPEWIDHGVNGLLVAPGDLEGLTTALSRLVNDPQLRRALGKAARVSVEPLAIDTYAARLGNIYRDVIRERKP